MSLIRSKAFIFTLNLGLAAFYLSSLSAEDTQIHSDIHYSLAKDGRTWKVGYEAKNKEQSITEYIPDDQTVTNWNDLFTVHHYFGINVVVDKYYEAFIHELEKMAPNSKVEHRLINKDPNSLFGEWWIHDKSPEAQHEWFRVFSDGRDVVVLRYTTKRIGDVDVIRPKVEDIIGKAQFKKEGESKIEGKQK